MRSRSPVKIALIVVSGLIFLIFVAVVGVLAFIGRQSGSNFILSEAKSILQKSYGVRMAYREGRIIPLSGLHFEDLVFTRGEGKDRDEVKFKSIDLKYHLSILGRSLAVEDVLLDHPSIFVRMHGTQPLMGSPTETKAPEAKKSSKGEDPVAEAEHYLEHPPLTLSVSNFKLDDLVLDVTYDDPSMGVSAKVKDLSAHGALTFKAGHLSTDGDFSLPEGNLIHFAQLGQAPMEVELSPYAVAKWKFDLDGAGNQWTYSLEPSQFKGGLEDLKAHLKSQEGTKVSEIDFKLEKARVDAEGTLSANTKGFLKFGSDSLEKLDAKKTFGTGLVAFVQKQGTVESAYSFASQEGESTIAWGVEAKGSSPSLKGRIKYALNHLDAKDVFVKPVGLDFESEYGFDSGHDTAEIQGKLLLEKINLADFNFTGSRVSEKSFGLKGTGDLQAGTELRALLKSTSALKLLGLIKAHLNLQGQTLAGAASTGVDADVEVTVTQSQASPQAPILFEPLLLKSHFSRSGDASAKIEFKSHLEDPVLRSGKTEVHQVKADFTGKADTSEGQCKADFDIAQVKALFLKKPLAVALSSDLNWKLEKDSQTLSMEADAKLGTGSASLEDVIHFTGKIDHPSAELVKIELALKTHPGKSLDNFLTPEQEKGIGDWNTETQFAAEVGLPPATSKQGFMQAGSFKGNGKTVVTQTQSPGLLASVEPISVEHRVDLAKGKLELEVRGEAPSLDVPKVVKISNSAFHAVIRSGDVAVAKDFEISAELNQGAVVLAPQVTKNAPPLTGIDFSMSASLENADHLTVQSMKGGFNHSMVSFTADAIGKLKQKEFQTKGKFTLEVPKDFPVIAGNRMTGSMEVPWELSVLHGRDIDMQGTLSLHNLGWSFTAAPRSSKKVDLIPQSMNVKGLSGVIPFAEKMVFDGKRIHFAYLINQNPFERVDYERVRPLINGENQFKIDSIGVEEKSYGPFIGFFSMKQNLLFAHQFDLSIGTTGRAYGEMYFDVYPANLQMGMLARLTQLNLVEILPSRYLKNATKDNKNLSGRTGIVINLNNGAVDGRVDINEIGGPQLVTLINVMDPNYEDAKMNLARTALSVGAPTFVGMAFQKGFMDMAIDLEALGLSEHYDLRGIPISTWVSSATSDIVQKTQEGPLK